MQLAGPSHPVEETEIITRSLSLGELRDLWREFTHQMNESILTWLLRIWDAAANDTILDGKDLQVHQGKRNTMEQGIRCLRELAVLEIIFSEDERFPKSPDCVQCTLQMWLKFAWLGPGNTSIAKSSHCDRACVVRERSRMEKSRNISEDFIQKAMAAANSMRRDELLFSYKGTLYPTTICSPETFKALESFEVRSDDVILAGYPKSGTNWLSQILTDLIAISQKKTPGSESSLNAEEQKEIAYLEVGDAKKYEILLLIRNPKDVATSFYHFSNGIVFLPSYETWNDFFTDFMTKKMAWGCYFEYISEWNKYADKENIMTITYEEVKENPALSVKNIATFFGIPLTEEELQLVLERSSFQSMKKNSDKTHGPIANALFRKGGVSDWKNLFSEDQSEKMDKAFEEHIAGTKLGKKLKNIDMTRNSERIIEIVDKCFSEGDKMAPEDMLFSYRGILYPAAISSPQTLEALKSFEARSDDVILVGYPKSGTNWLEQMVKELADAKYTEEEMKERINAEKKLETFQRLEFGDPGIYEILVLVRNPKDTAVSYYHFCNKLPVMPSFASWDEYFADFMNGKLAWGSYFDHLVEWNKYINNERIMTISYEELKEDPILGMKKIASFFGFSLCEEDFSRIAKKTSFKAMKEKSSETHGKFGDILFRKGVVGNWRDVFSKAQNEEMYQKFQDSLGGTKMAAKIKYDVYCKA
ncbi:Sulfotransferase 6B1 [Lonchura striata]|uniref:Sulfotransferase 6B1 n=1 Tax=Lonchura striata TaxID=40157 RepID=A0A218V5T4_9PASE|nr:Sulfotransferase 6B1 [Lonchura striata domestica]